MSYSHLFCRFYLAWFELPRSLLHFALSPEQLCKATPSPCISSGVAGTSHWWVWILGWFVTPPSCPAPLSPACGWDDLQLVQPSCGWDDLYMVQPSLCCGMIS